MNEVKEYAYMTEQNDQIMERYPHIFDKNKVWEFDPDQLYDRGLQTTVEFLLKKSATVAEIQAIAMELFGEDIKASVLEMIKE